MASASTSFSNRPKLNHTINTKIVESLPANTYTRTVSAGSSILGSFRVETYHTESTKDRYIPVQKVNTFEEYIAGCNEHEKCLGHFCITPRGTLLLPQKMASTLGIMSNDYAKMAEAVFNRDSQSQEIAYREKLKGLMLGKSGKMRGSMVAGPVDSSAREIISLCWDMPTDEQEYNHFAVPKVVASNMRVLRIARDGKTNLPLGYYTEDCLREGDWVVIVRPPSLWAGNVQPAKVVLWDHECFGLDPSNADEFHADHDGDEMQLYFIGKENSIEQCKKWKKLTPCKFLETVRNNILPMSCIKPVLTMRYQKSNIEQSEYPPEIYPQLRKTFMIHSTLSIKELLDGERLPPIAKAARMKEPMANMFVERLKNPEKVFEDFCKESIRGIKDVMAQQLNQGYLGDMSRQARLAASCIKYVGRGIFHIKSSTETIRILCPPLQDVSLDTKYSLGGNSCMRAVTALCSVAQQAALDSHRVSQEVSSKLDLINNLITGGKESLIAVSPGSVPPHSWKYETEKLTYCIVVNESVKVWGTRIVASYNPIVFKAIKLMNGDVRTVCRNGIIMVCNYYGVKLSLLELYSLTELLCYRCEAYEDPITTKKGLLRRDMRWMAVTFANHYGKLRELQLRGKTKRPVRPETVTDTVAFCNFDYA